LSAARLAARLGGRRAFITGGGSGLGLALATLLARDGWTVGLLDRESARLAAAGAAVGAAGAQAVHTFAADVRDEAAFGAALESFVTACGGLDLMVNNAGVAVAGSLEATPVADWRWALEINVIGAALGCRLALPVMRRAGRGLLVNIASAAAFAAAPQMATYNASKAAVVALTETLAAELGGSGVRALVVMPGFFQTRLLETLRAPPAAAETARRVMAASRYSAERAAADVLAAAARGRLYAVLPGSYAALWRLKRLLPALFVRLLSGARARAAFGNQPGGGSTERR
jgi:NAD(P)-dependent dehydrogenase (short-subunit alcohol dehydrogenase family)